MFWSQHVCLESELCLMVCQFQCEHEGFGIVLISVWAQWVCHRGCLISLELPDLARDWEVEPCRNGRVRTWLLDFEQIAGYFDQEFCKRSGVIDSSCKAATAGTHFVCTLFQTFSRVCKCSIRVFKKRRSSQHERCHSAFAVVMSLSMSFESMTGSRIWFRIFWSSILWLVADDDCNDVNSLLIDAKFWFVLLLELYIQANLITKFLTNPNLR